MFSAENTIQTWPCPNTIQSCPRTGKSVLGPDCFSAENTIRTWPWPRTGFFGPRNPDLFEILTFRILTSDLRTGFFRPRTGFFSPKNQCRRKPKGSWPLSKNPDLRPGNPDLRPENPDLPKILTFGILTSDLKILTSDLGLEKSVLGPDCVSGGKHDSDLALP